jgi:hypothetical protein
LIGHFDPPNLCLYGLTYLPVWRKVDLDAPDCNPIT